MKSYNTWIWNRKYWLNYIRCKKSKEKKNSDQKNHIEKLSAQIEKLKDENDFTERLKNQDIKKEINDYEAEIKRLNKIVSDKDEELTQIRHKLENQESVIDQYWQHIKVLQQQNDDSKKTHKSDIAKNKIKNYPTIPKKFSY